MTDSLRRARSALTSLGRRAGSGADPIAVLWRLLEAPALWYACLTASALLALSAFVLPLAYIPAANAFGWSTDLWPGGYQRTVALSLMGSAVWGQVVLIALAVLSAVRAASDLGPARPGVRAAKAAADLDTRATIYTELPAQATRTRLGLISALLGYRLRPEDGAPASLVASTDAMHAVARAGLAVTLVALAVLALAAPKVTAAEVLDLEPGDPGRSKAAGLVLTYAATPEPAVEVSGSATSFSLRQGESLRKGDLLFAWRLSGPALAVSAADGAPSQDLVIPFLADETSKYVAVPETGGALGVSLIRGGGDPVFQVQPLNVQGQPSGELYEVSGPVVVTLAGADLALAPAQYQVVSITRMPLWWAFLAAALAAPGFLALAWAWRGPPLRLALGEQAEPVAVEVETASACRRHRLWVTLARLILR